MEGEPGYFYLGNKTLKISFELHKENRIKAANNMKQAGHSGLIFLQGIWIYYLFILLIDSLVLNIY